jgi:signal transduction histidine kinase
MRRSLAARIYAGFLLITIAFGAVMGFVAFRMHQVGQQLELINISYLGLTLNLGEIDTTQGKLINELSDRVEGAPASSNLRHQVRVARRFRLSRVDASRQIVIRAQRQELSPVDRRFVQQTEQTLATLEKGFRANEELVERIFASEPPLAVSDREAGSTLLQAEQRLAGHVLQLRNRLRGRVKAASLQVEANQRTITGAGMALMLLALFVALSVTVLVRRMLRPLGTLVQQTKRIRAGDYASRIAVQSKDELGVLAEEFNAMAFAVQEREQRLLRSERLAAAGRLASHITHEVRNPLSAISLNAEMLEEELSQLSKESGSEALQLCREIYREVDRLTEITEEYLSFARLPKPNLAQEEINEILASLLAFVDKELQEKRVVVERNFDPALPAVQADEGQLRQAFLNLIRNAGEAMVKTSGGRLAIQTTRNEMGQVVIRFADTGPGIEAEDPQQVFEAFFSTKERGTGLGLSLTQQIIHEHGGSITVQSQTGVGATFTITLPPSSRQK